MIVLLARRLVLLIPTLFVILWFSFYLSISAPGDEVMSRMSLEGKNTNVSRAEFVDLYRDVQSKLAKDRPSFYFSIVPHYVPSDIYNIVPKSYRDNLLSINRQVKSWDRVEDYHLKLEEGLSLIQDHSRELREVSTFLNNMQKINSVVLLDSKILELDGILDQETLTAYPVIRNYLIQFKTQMSEVGNKNSSWTYPVFRWNGSHNQFQYWLTSIYQPSKRVSLRDGAPVWSKISSALTWTLTLSLISLTLACMLSLMVAVAQMRYNNSLFDRLIAQVLYVLYAIPLFWFATMMVVFFTTDDYGVWTNVFPSVGLKYWANTGSSGEVLWAKGKLLILPIFCIAVNSLTYLTRQLKSDLQRQSDKPYVMSVRAKGVGKSRLIWRHLLPNALIPYITIITGAIPKTLVGSVVIEFIFNIPGVGKLLMDSIHHSDWPVTFSIILIVGVMTILSYILADVLYMIFYPHMAKSLLNRSV